MKMLLMTPPPQPLDTSITPPLPDLTHTQISFNTIVKTSTPEALRLYGYLRHSRVTMLIDGGQYS